MAFIYLKLCVCCFIICLDQNPKWDLYLVIGWYASKFPLFCQFPIHLFTYLVTCSSILLSVSLPLPRHLFVEGISCLLTVSHIWRWLTSSPRLSLTCSSVSCSSYQLLVESRSLIRFRFEFWARLLHGWCHRLSSGGSSCPSLCDARPSFCDVSTSGCPVHSWWWGRSDESLSVSFLLPF